jgi:integrase
VPELPKAATLRELGLPFTEAELTHIRTAMALHKASRQPQLTYDGWKVIGLALNKAQICGHNSQAKPLVHWSHSLCDQSPTRSTQMTPQNAIPSTTRFSRKATSRRKSNRAYRTREHLTEREVGKLLVALKRNRHGHRDWLIALIIFRHGLRVSEACDLRWDDLDLPKRQIMVRRLKGSTDSTHYLERNEVNALKLLAPAAGQRQGPSLRLCQRTG